ncbi:N-alpha-acetyltransferase 80-like [Ruditapes philippinarum]|uniref:N-alpha-acetyltransferase 80-like n=1 Tax=Ruditapes philippinarum TaxID=129788 RepID=UPI00295C399C|nr:N-alpha-acetyltransferase 80-like [Ruditapes philippinarum]
MTRNLFRNQSKHTTPKMELQALHKVPGFINECAEVLNEEWKRSLTARLYSLEKSKDNFPICLVLLKKEDNGKQFVVGHSMLSIVRGQPVQSCLVESVVVKKSHRGKGYGRIVMNKTEEFAASRGYKVMYLTTHDKQKFYEHLGYEYCSPIVTFNTDIIPEHFANKLIGSLGSTAKNIESSQVDKLHEDVIEENKSTKYVDNSHGDCDTILSDRLSSMTTSDIVPSNTSRNETVTNKVTAQPPPPPNAPPPPPPPPVIAPVVNKLSPDNQGNDKVTRWNPALVSWMKKTIS